jgi:hypothetical protein
VKSKLVSSFLIYQHQITSKMPAYASKGSNCASKFFDMDDSQVVLSKMQTKITNY